MKLIRKFGFAITALMLTAAFVFFVLLISGISKVTYLKLDLSENRVFSLSETTKDFLKTVENEITIYYLTEENRESPYIQEVIARYESYGKNIRVETVDMIKNPMFLNKYINTDEVIDKGSIIIESDKRFTTVSPDAAIKIISAAGADGVTYATGFELEKQLTNAIDYVTSDNEISIGYVSGHESVDFTLLAEKLEKENALVEEAGLDGDISKYDVIVFFGIKTDITADEEAQVREYLSNGGSVCIVSNPGVRCPLLYSIASDYGISINSDILSEGDPSKIIYNEKHCFEGNLAEYKITENIKDTKILVPFAASLTISEKEGYAVMPLISSGKTVRAYKVEDNIETEFINADIHCISAISETDKSRLMVISSTQLFASGNEMLNRAVSTVDYANNDFFAQSIKYMADPDGRYISVLPKNIASRSISLTASQKTALTVVFGFVLPGVVLALGAIVCIRRRNL